MANKPYHRGKTWLCMSVFIGAFLSVHLGWLAGPANHINAHPVGMSPIQLAKNSSSNMSGVSTSKNITTAAESNLDIEVWARPPSPAAASPRNPLRWMLTAHELEQLTRLCGRCLYHSLENVMHARSMGDWTFVATGDIALMWIRDSAVQLSILLPRMASRPAIRTLVEGGIKTQAFYITQDPYANGYLPHWKHPKDHHKADRLLGRGGWVGVRNFELDSGAYYLNLLWNYYRTDGLYRPEALLQEPLLFEAAMLLVDTWVTEQRHEDESPYRYSELPRNGLGMPVGYTGMVWSAFRPSDDANQYGYSIPSNMYAAAGLQRALRINQHIWKSDIFEQKAGKLLADITAGIDQHGLVMTSDGQVVYAYEVDGLGGQLHDFDDPNLPSLVGMPLLGFRYNHEAYLTTRARILNKSYNRLYYSGKYFSGLGSPHTVPGMVWALGVFSEALTASTPTEQARALRTLMSMQCSDGLMHESVHVNDLHKCSRKWFEWANALLVVAVEQTVGVDCNESAEMFYQDSVQARESRDKSHQPANEGKDLAAYYQPFIANVQHDGQFIKKVDDWKGIGWFLKNYKPPVAQAQAADSHSKDP